MFQNLRRVQVAASDFPRSRRFYGETLGLPEIGGFESDWVEFGLGPIILKLVPLRPGEVPSRNQVAAILSTARLEETLSTLKERGVTVTRGPLDEFTGRYAEILDPDGYRIVAFQPSDLHPDDEWVPMSHVDDVVKAKLLARRQKERAKSVKPAPKKAPPKKAPPKKATPKKAAAKAKKPQKKAAKPAKPAKAAPSKKPASRPPSKKIAKPAKPSKAARKPAKKSAARKKSAPPKRKAKPTVKPAARKSTAKPARTKK
jgi:predicted enzyme related to lactoylglutathione lyase